MLKEIVIYTPKEARTKDTVAFFWDKVTEGTAEVIYEIYVDGEKEQVTKDTDVTLENLLPDREYEIFVRASVGGNPIAESRHEKVRTKKAGKVYSVTDYGAVGDGRRLNTKAIQQAIDACEEDGTVYVPEGVYVTGALFLKSDMTLYVEKGATLLGSTDTADYPVFTYRNEGRMKPSYAALINMPMEVPHIGAYEDTQDDEQEVTPYVGRVVWKNVTICGGGVINANGVALNQKEISENKGARGRAVCLRNIDGLYLYDITVRQSPMWCLHTIFCNHVSMNRIKIYNKYDENGKPYGLFNNDGVDADSCSDVNIFRCMIESQDDTVAIKSGMNEEGRRVGIPSTRIRVTNCLFSYGFGVVIGSDMSGGVSDVLVQDCVYNNSFSVASIKPPRGRGNVVERVIYENLTLVNRHREYGDCRWFRGAINIDQFYSEEFFDPNKCEEITEATPAIRNIVFRNITLDTVGGNAVYMCGLPEKPITGIVMENITAKGIRGIKLVNVDEITLNQVAVRV